VPVLVLAMRAMERLYAGRRAAVRVEPATVVGPPVRRQHVYVPASDVTRDVVHAIKLARTMADDVHAVHVTDDRAAGEAFRERFQRQLPSVPVVLVESPYRELVRPLIRFLEERAAEAGDDVIVVLLPTYLPARPWERLLHHGNGPAIRDALLGLPNVLIAEVPYRRPDADPPAALAPRADATLGG
jgi:hypothetical protein